jgi:uncharacterized membrane protein YccF (DUF307 family)
MESAVNPGAVVELKAGPSILLRAVWFLLVGWWLSGFVMGIAWFFGLTVIGLPLTFYMANRIPTVLTLRPRRERYQLVQGADGVTRYERIATEQSSYLVRLVYFLLVGWWVSGFWMFAAWILCVSIIGFPVGLMMVNRVPFVMTLHRGYA